MELAKLEVPSESPQANIAIFGSRSQKIISTINSQCEFSDGILMATQSKSIFELLILLAGIEMNFLIYASKKEQILVFVFGGGD